MKNHDIAYEVGNRHSVRSRCYHYSFVNNVSVGQIALLPDLNLKSCSFQVLTPINYAVSGKLCNIPKIPWENNDGFWNTMYLLT